MTGGRLLGPTCLEPGRKGDIIVAVIAEALVGLPSETESCIRYEITEDHGKGLYSPFLDGPSFLNCLNQAQTLELSVSELARQFGGVSGDERDCIRQVKATGFSVAERLISGDPQYSMTITFEFTATAILAV